MVKGGAFTKHKHKHQKNADGRRVEYVGDPTGRDVDRQALLHTGRRPVSGGSGTGKPTRRGGKLVRAKTHRARKTMESREPKAVENPKTTLLLRGNKCGQNGSEALKDIVKMKDGDVVKLNRKNTIYPFDDASELERLAATRDCSLFVLSNHTKKRPNNLILGRLFDGHVFEMIEFGMESFVGMQELGNLGKAALVANSKPCILFQGPEFEYCMEMKQARSVLLDLFKGRDVSGVNLLGLDHVIVCTSTSEKNIKLRHYCIQRSDKKKKGEASSSAASSSSSSSSSSNASPAVNLLEIGPRMDLVVRRNQLPTPDLEKQALRVPQELRVTNKKNLSHEATGQMGRVHMERQDLRQMALKKMKTFKKQRRLEKVASKRAASEREDAGGDGEVEQVPHKRNKR